MTPWRLNRNRLLGLAAGGIALAVIASALAMARLPLFRLQQPMSDGRRVEVAAGQAVRQSVSSRYPGLTRIVLKLAEPWPAPGQRVSLRVTDADSGQERLALTQTWAQPLVFDFAPLDDSQGHRYILEVSTAGPRPLVLAAHGGDMYTAGALDGGGDLVFAAHYNGPALASLGTLLTQLSAGKPGLFGQGWFYALLAGLHVVTLAVAVQRIGAAGRPQRRQEQD